MMLKYIFICVTLFLAACTVNEPVMEETHMGCQEGELDENGMCILSEEQNVDLFNSQVSVRSQRVTGEVSGYFAQPQVEGDYPGVIMIHEWWGLNENIKQMADILANEGYNVFAVDLYQGQVAQESETAMKLVSEVRENPQDAIETMRKAKAYLQERGSQNIGSLGWCFGGQQSLQLSLNEELDATVIYYGQLIDNTTQLQNLNGPVLGIFGAEDLSISVESIEGFQSALNKIGIQNDIHVYGGVGHAFANPTGSNYASNETIDAWDKTLSFLDENLKNIKQTDSREVVEVSQPDVEFNITGEIFAFYENGEQNPVLTVSKGDLVRINFESTSGFHDWVVDEFDAYTKQVSGGEQTYVEFIADESGSFEYYCSVGQHRANGMVGTFVVK